MPLRRRFWLSCGAVLAALASAALGYLVGRYRIQPLSYVTVSSLPLPVFNGSQLTLQLPNGNLVGEVGSYSDELTAYLRFQYLRGLSRLSGMPLLMRTRESEGAPQYLLYVVLQNDLLTQAHWLSELERDGYIGSFDLQSPPTPELREWAVQTRLFEASYERPVKERLLTLPQRDLTSAVAKFILFKMRTDRRVRERLEPASEKLSTAEDARDFAADMIEVAKFYDIPLDMLLGVGAMENNYLDVRGDLKHAVWKRHAQRGDIVLRRRGGRVLVSNYSSGPWQITRETLRYVHELYLKDTRDYSQIPERLRPPGRLDLDHLDTHVLTTYAGLLLRELLDEFDGDVVKAQGAYNGGRANPNLEYSEGVSIVSRYAHRVLSMAAGRKGNSVAETPLKVSVKQKG